MSSQPPPSYAATNQPVQDSEPPKLGFGGRLTNVFFAPSETFADVNRAAKPVLPIIALCLVSLLGSFLIQWRLHPDFGAIARQKVEQSLEAQGKTIDDLNDQQKQGIEMQVKWSGIIGKYIPLIAIFTTPIGIGLVALFFWVGTLITQSKATYPKVYSIVAWASLGVGIVQVLVNFIGTFIRSPSDIDITEGVIITNLSPLVTLKASPVVHVLLKQLDVFTIWFLILCTIGLVCVSRKKTFGQMAIATFGCGDFGLLYA